MPPLVAGSLTWLALGSLCSLFKFLVVKNLNVKDRILCICCGTLCAANAVIPVITCTSTAADGGASRPASLLLTKMESVLVLVLVLAADTDNSSCRLDQLGKLYATP